MCIVGIWHLPRSGPGGAGAGRWQICNRMCGPGNDVYDYLWLCMVCMDVYEVICLSVNVYGCMDVYACLWMFMGVWIVRRGADAWVSSAARRDHLQCGASCLREGYVVRVSP